MALLNDLKDCFVESGVESDLKTSVFSYPSNMRLKYTGTPDIDALLLDLMSMRLHTCVHACVYFYAALLKNS